MNANEESLNYKERERYSRQILLPEIGIEKQELLKSARVLIVGVGGLGCPVSLYLAAAGIGSLGLVEPDTVSLSNLHRQILYGSEDVGRSKLQVAKAKLESLNPHIQVYPYESELSAANAEDILSNYDVIVDATDNFSTRYLLNDCCILMKKPLVYGSVSQFRGLISLVSPGQGPCYRCFFPNPPPSEAIPSCTDGGILGVIPGTIALLQATEVLKNILKIGNPLTGKVLFFEGLETRFKEIVLAKDPKCIVCGDFPMIHTFSDLHTKGSYRCDLPADLSEIIPEQLRDVLNSTSDSRNEINLIDVREYDEARFSKIGHAKVIPLRELADRLSEIPHDRRIILYCKSGVRSGKALKLLINQGYSRVEHLKGGIDAYKRLDNEFQI